MYVLRIEMSVTDYDGWKQAFDSDPADRAGSGVRWYRVMRGVDEPNRVMVDMELGSAGEAERLAANLRAVWSRMGDGIIANPQARVLESVEAREY